MATPRAGPKCLVCTGEEQLHKMTCLKHAFAAIRLQNSTKRRRDDDDDDNANINVGTNASGSGSVDPNPGIEGLANNPGVSDANNNSAQGAQLLNDAEADRERARRDSEDMEESWRAWYVSRRRKF